MPDVFTLRDDAAITDTPVAFADFLNASNAAAVRIEPGDDARALLLQLDQLRLVEVHFPAFTEGRGYSAARILREAGYAGELRAVGDIAVDMLSHMKRCGFDSFLPNAPLDATDAEAALNRWPHVYQATADGRAPVWKLRHG
jgi:uncharacterized protein (DUF934 family)